MCGAAAVLCLLFLLSLFSLPPRCGGCAASGVAVTPRGGLAKEEKAMGERSSVSMLHSSRRGRIDMVSWAGE